MIEELKARIAELEQKLYDSLDAERDANMRIIELERKQGVLVEALTSYMTTYNEHWKRGMPILEPMGDAALAAVREPADHIEHDLEKVRGPTSSPAGEGGDRG